MGHGRPGQHTCTGSDSLLNGRGNVTDVDTPLPGMSGLGPDDGTIYHTCSTYERAPDEYDNQ